MRLRRKTLFYTTTLTIFMAVWLTACGSSSATLATQDPPVSPAEASALQAALDKAVSDCKVPGAVMAIRTPEGKVWKGTSGISEYERNIPMDTAMHFYIGSVTKTYTATAIMMLIDRKTPTGNGATLTLDTTVKQVLPELHLVNENNITLTDLLDMKSGLTDYSTLNPQWDADFVADPGRVWTPLELVQDSNGTFEAPNTSYHYSNANYIILGMMIEKLTGMTYAEAIKKMILDPVGLSQTSIPDNPSRPEPYASAYLINKDGVRINATYLNDPSWAWAAGSMVSTVSDQLKWLDVLIKGSLLSPAMREARLPKTVPGYGLGIFAFNGGLGHNGNFNSHYTSFVYRYHDYDIVIFTNGQAVGGSNNLSFADNIFRDMNATLAW